jgi:flagellar basal-body rod modification protein FlgD
MQTNAAQSSSAAPGASGSPGFQHDAFQDLDLNTFIDLLVTEMQNQDPMNPMDNQQILDQISQIRSIESNTRLTATLEAVLTGQNMATAGSLIGRTVTGLTDDGERITGKVDRVTVADGKTKLHIGEKTIAMKNVGEIVAETS